MLFVVTLDITIYILHLTKSSNYTLLLVIAKNLKHFNSIYSFLPICYYFYVFKLHRHYYCRLIWPMFISVYIHISHFLFIPPHISYLPAGIIFFCLHFIHNISCNAVLLMKNSLSFCWYRNVFISSLFSKDIFTGYRILYWQYIFL